MREKYFILGSYGQLGSEFRRKLAECGLEFDHADIDSLDITNSSELAQALRATKPTTVINCSAYTQVDLAEANPELAMNVNARAVGVMAEECRRMGARFVHFGTDYVFSGENRNTPYTETDVANPLSVYGKSKLRGEELAAAAGAEYLIFRLSWVYGLGKQNFIYKLLSWAANRDELNIADDEVSVPTPVGLIADSTLGALGQGMNGLYHLVPAGHCSRFEWAEAILDYYSMNKKLNRVSKDIFKLPARRPSYSVLSNEAVSRDSGLKFANWREYLQIFLDLNDFCA